MILKAQEARALLGRELIDHHCLSQRQLGDMPWEAERSLAGGAWQPSEVSNAL